jgi:hypothetical protein
MAYTNTVVLIGSNTDNNISFWQVLFRAQQI